MQTDIRFPPEGLQQNWRRIADSKNTQNTGIYTEMWEIQGIGKSRAVTRCSSSMGLVFCLLLLLNAFLFALELWL